MNELAWVTLGTLVGLILAWVLFRIGTKTQSGSRGTSILKPRAPDGTEALDEKRHAQEILERMTEGVLVLDENLRPGFANRSAHDLLGLRGSRLPQRLPSLEIADVARDSRIGNRTTDGLVEVFYPRKMTLRVEATPLAATSGVLVVLQDVSEELRTQRIRREFVAHASHELKSPVASLATLADAIVEAIPDDLETAERFARKLRAEAERLGDLVSDLLDLSRLEEPAAKPEDPCDLALVARQELAQLDPVAANQEVALTWDVDDRVPVTGDPRQLGLLVRNLLDNAIHYTNQGGTVRLEARVVDGEALLRVSDDGVGIPLEAQERVFERFFRVDRARSRARGGTGLGLAIVKHVVEQHGGRIEMESELGLGSTFTVKLPLSAPVEHELAPTPEESSKRSA